MDAKQKVLLVDDDPLIVQIYSGLLEQAGFEVEAVPTGKEAIARLKDHPPDAVLLDLFLPPSKPSRTSCGID